MYVLYNQEEEKRLPNHASFYFQFIKGESMLLHLDMKGVPIIEKLRNMSPLCAIDECESEEACFTCTAKR